MKRGKKARVVYTQLPAKLAQTTAVAAGARRKYEEPPRLFSYGTASAQRTLLVPSATYYGREARDICRKRTDSADEEGGDRGIFFLSFSS